jgi:hypothetical protein
MVISPISSFIRLNPEEGKDADPTFVALDRGVFPEDGDLLKTLERLVSATGLFRTEYAALTYLVYGMGLSDSNLKAAGWQKPMGTMSAARILLEFSKKHADGSARELSRILKIVLPCRAEEAMSIGDNTMPSSPAEIEGSSLDEVFDVVNEKLLEVLRPPSIVDFHGFHELCNETVSFGQNDRIGTARVLIEPLNNIEDTRLVVFRREGWKILWKVRRLLNGQAELLDAQQRRNPRLVRWYEQDMNDETSLNRSFSSFLNQHGQVYTPRRDAISHWLDIVTQTGERHRLTYFQALGQIAIGTDVFEIDELVKKIDSGESDLVLEQLRMTAVKKYR